MNILITCCGRKIYLIEEVRQALIKLFPDEEHRVFITESYEYSPSLLHADKGYIVPPIIEENYIHEISNVCREDQISFILPTKDMELMKFARTRNLFNDITIPISSVETIVICEDKLRFSQAMSNFFRVPRIYETKNCHAETVLFPVVIKERGVGIETSGCYLCNKIDELSFYIEKCTQPIIQEYISGMEYTVDAIFRADSTPVVVIPRKRLRTRQSVSDVGLVVDDPELIKLTIDVGRRLNITGPANIQWIKDKKGTFYLLEVNPRISGGLQISLAACPEFIFALIQTALGVDTKPLEYQFPILSMKYDSIVSKRL